MIPLAVQQEALLDALFAWPPQDACLRLGIHASGVGTQAGRGLKVYQSNGHMLAQRAMAAAYPVMAAMLGEESFADLARALWHAHPPQGGDVAAWGQAMADFVRSSEQLRDTPYLSDVAQAEWALHRCGSAPDGEARLQTLELLTTEEAHTLALDMAPGLATVSSRWPLASMLLAHLEGGLSLDEVREQLKCGHAQDVVIWRAGLQPKLREALPGELLVLQALHDQQDLASALQCGAELDVSRWLPLAVQSGLVLGVRHHRQVL